MRNRNTVAAVLLAAALAVLPLAWSAHAQKKSPGSVFQPDKGKFNILVDGKSVGKEEFEISPNGGGWVAKGATEITTDGQSAHITGNLTLQTNGAPIAYDWVSKADKTNSAHIVFTNGIANIAL